MRRFFGHALWIFCLAIVVFIASLKSEASWRPAQTEPIDVMRSHLVVVMNRAMENYPRSLVKGLPQNCAINFASELATEAFARLNNLVPKLFSGHGKAQRKIRPKFKPDIVGLHDGGGLSVVVKGVLDVSHSGIDVVQKKILQDLYMQIWSLDTKEGFLDKFGGLNGSIGSAAIQLQGKKQAHQSKSAREKPRKSKQEKSVSPFRHFLLCIQVVLGSLGVAIGIHGVDEALKEGDNRISLFKTDGGILLTSFCLVGGYILALLSVVFLIFPE